MLLTLLTIAMGLAVGWSIGANDAANSLGTAVGSRVLTVRKALVLICVFGLAGALLQGGHVVKTIGKGIVPMDKLDRHTACVFALVASFAGCAWVVLATYWRMPISTSHSMVGAVAGAGLAIAAPVKWRILGDVFICWVLTPIGAAVLAYGVYWILRRVFHRIVPERWAGPVLAALIVLSGCYVAYSWGANDVANAVGVIAGGGILSPVGVVALGGIAIAVGVVTWGHKVMATIGGGIVNLEPLMAFSAQLASAVNVHIYTVIGIPVSTSHSIVGAIVGVGLVKGVRVVNIGIMREIVTCWLATPLISGIISFGVLAVVKALGGLR